MKKMINIRMLALVISGLFVSAALFAQSANIYRMKVLGGSRIWVEGDSTLHRYHSSTSAINLDTEIVFKAAPLIAEGPIRTLVMNKATAPTLRRLELNLAVKKFHSQLTGFDGQFHRTLKSDEHPTITFSLTNYSVAPDGNSNDRFIIRTNGVVRIAGKDKAITVTSVGKLGEQSATVTGQVDLLMTDFMIEPPRLLFVTTDNKVTIKWNLLLGIEPQVSTLLSEK